MKMMGFCGGLLVSTTAAIWVFSQMLVLASPTVRLFAWSFVGCLTAAFLFLCLTVLAFLQRAVVVEEEEPVTTSVRPPRRATSVTGADKDAEADLVGSGRRL